MCLCFLYFFVVIRFYSCKVPERIRAMNASVKLLLIVREPVTRAISDYTQLRSHAATVALPSLTSQQNQNQGLPASSPSSPISK